MDPLFERDQKGFPREEVPPRPGVLERPDRKAVSKRMNREESSIRGVGQAGKPEDRGEMPVCA